MKKANKIILQELDPNAKYIMLLSERYVHFDSAPELPKGIDPRNFVIFWVDDVDKAIRFVKIPEKDTFKKHDLSVANEDTEQL